MNYDFKNTEEFKDFILDSLQSGRYNQEIENLEEGINTISNDKLDWRWLEWGKLYVVESRQGSLYFIYQPPPSSKQFKTGSFWYIGCWGSNTVRMWSMSFHADSKAWVMGYIALDSHSSGFINWKGVPWGDLK